MFINHFFGLIHMIDFGRMFLKQIPNPLSFDSNPLSFDSIHRLIGWLFWDHLVTLPTPLFVDSINQTFENIIVPIHSFILSPFRCYF